MEINTNTEHPAFLTAEEIENPFLVIHDHMDNCYLSSLREAWWDMLYYAFSSREADGLPASTRAEYFFIHKSMLKLAEAASIIAPWKLHTKIAQLETLE